MHRNSSHTPIFRNSPITTLLKHLIDFVLVTLNTFDSLILPSFQVLEVSKTADSSGSLNLLYSGGYLPKTLQILLLLFMLFLILIGKYLHALLPGALIPCLLFLDSLVVLHHAVILVVQGDGYIFVLVILLEIGAFGRQNVDILNLIIVLVTLLDQVIAIFP